MKNFRDAMVEGYLWDYKRLPLCGSTEGRMGLLGLNDLNYLKYLRFDKIDRTD